MQPDGTYTKVKPAPGQPPVDSQMAMFGYFQNGFEQAAEKSAPAVKPVANVRPPQPNPLCVPARPAALRPAKTGLLQNLFGRNKK